MTQQEAIQRLIARLDHARREHPVFADSEREALRVIDAEVNELAFAIHNEGPDRIIDEALDVAATAMRLVMGEVQG